MSVVAWVVVDSFVNLEPEILLLLNVSLFNHLICFNKEVGMT